MIDDRIGKTLKRTGKHKVACERKHDASQFRSGVAQDSREEKDGLSLEDPTIER